MRPRLTLLMLMVASPLSAQSFEDISALDAQIAAVAGAPVGQAGGALTRIDPRLKLARCPVAVSVEPVNQGAFTLRCAALGWRVRVPAASVAATGPVVATIRRGDVVDLTVAGGGFEVSTTVVATEDGAAGTSIRVKNPTAGTVMTATIVNSGQVIIHE